MAEPFGDARDWFLQKRFGMFVHWGIYAIPGWQEQHQWRGRVPADEYITLKNQWNPVHYNPEAWLDLAEEAGMQYLVITTKHHDGFCLWDTQQTDFNTMNTPCGKDLIRPLADACHARNFPLGFYYSIADWHHPNCPNQGRHHELPGPKPGDDPDLMKYLEFLKAQVRELCTEYGQLHAFWWDMNVDQHVDPSINAMIRELQPTAVINNRGFDDGDFGTPERDYEQGIEEQRDFDRLTEACQSVGMESWGYRTNEDYYTDRHLMRSIDRYLARNANYLLNVGPKPDGSFPDEAAGILRRIGKWYHAVREALENVVPASNLTQNKDILLTRKDNTLYVHLVNDPRTHAVKLDPIHIAPNKATLLNTGEPVEFAVELVPSNHIEHKPYLRLRNLPVNDQINTVLVIKLEFDLPL
ncbi:MAG: alpha-L-fucosidase [bacterium]|nr:alpha-L-fucosidase [bacterium]